MRAAPDGQPAAVRLTRRWLSVARVLEHWRLDDEWWRERPQVRWYYRLLLTDGRPCTVFQDQVAGAWFTQPYGG